MRRGHLVLAVLVLSAAGCGATQQVHLDTGLNALPADVQGAIAGGCRANVSSDAPSNYCQCALEWVEANIPVDQIGDPTIAGNTATKDRDILKACS